MEIQEEHQMTIILTLAAIGALTVVYNLYQVAAMFQNKRATRLAKKLSRREKARRPSNFYKPDTKDQSAASKNAYAY